jgi:beta-glucosidase-like glycosyl hydrolase
VIRKSAPRRFDDVGAGPRSTPNCSNGACSDATYIASGAQAKASREETVSGREAAVLGVNVNFDPCVDILVSGRNTIVNTRAYDTAADDVIRGTSGYFHGLRAKTHPLTCIKHFPGDGVEKRDSTSSSASTTSPPPHGTRSSAGSTGTTSTAALK